MCTTRCVSKMRECDKRAFKTKAMLLEIQIETVNTYVTYTSIATITRCMYNGPQDTIVVKTGDKIDTKINNVQGL